MPRLPAMICRLLIAIMTFLATPTAWAQATSTSTSGTGGIFADSPLKDLTVLVGVTVSHDSNLFRRPVSEQSETITSGYVGLRLDKSISQQQFLLDITKTANRYQKFKNLDFDALSYSGAWNWQLGKQFSGKLSASRSESLAPFEDTTGNGRNVRISESQAFNVDYWVSGGWYLLAGVSRSDQTSEQNTISRTPDSKTTNGSLGVKYQTRAGNTLSVLRQSTKGKFVNAPIGSLNSDFSEDLSEISADWKLTAASTLNARIGWLEHNNDDPTRRDFSGPSSSINYSWNPGGKLSLGISAARKTSPLQDPAATYREDSSLTVTPVWRISAKTSSFLRLSYQESDDRGVLIALPTGPRRDKTSIAAVGVDWSATRTLRINASIEQQQRTSTLATAGYDATIARISAALAF